MRYPILVTAVSLALGGGVALAGGGQPQGSNQPSQPAHSSEQPAQPSEKAAATEKKESVDLFFENDSAELGDKAGAELKELATWARCTPDGAIILEGHASSTGPADYNRQLSAERAAVVRKKLIAMGVPSERIVISVYGETGPSRPNLAEERRVTARGVTTPVAPTDFGPKAT